MRTDNATALLHRDKRVSPLDPVGSRPSSADKFTSEIAASVDKNRCLGDEQNITFTRHRRVSSIQPAAPSFSVRCVKNRSEDADRRLNRCGESGASRASTCRAPTAFPV